MTSFEEFFKMDLLESNADTDPESFLNFYFDDDKDPLAIYNPPTNTAPFDFLGAFINSPSTPSTTPDSFLPSPQFAIDPQLVDTPSSKTPSDFGDPDPDDHDHDDDDDDDEHALTLKIPAPKLVARGKVRNPLVAGGGIVKKSVSPLTNSHKKNTISSVVATGPKLDDDLDDWRPSPEEYKKMSSKEKRQLRNKISARNFRVRRKEYITTLEADIHERDSLLSAIRSELGSTQSENAALRQEIAALKKALLDGRGPPVLPPPAPLPTPAPTTATPTPTPTSTPALLTPNTHKDLPTSPRMSSRGFWGGVGAGALNGMGGFTPVHTALIPELSVMPWGKKGYALENLNPALNAGRPSTPPSPLAPSDKWTAFEAFSDSNAFTLKALDTYRMHLWFKMAAQQRSQQQQYQQQQQYAQQQQQQQQPPYLPPTTAGRPHYFAHHGSSAGISSLLSGKASASSSTHKTLAPAPTKEQAVMAALASQTLLRRLGGAFWDAFSGGGGGAAGAGAKTGAWDAEKVRRVLEGRAVVRVVDVDVDARQQQQVQQVQHAATVQGEGKKEKCMLADMLVESMNGLNLKK